MAIRKRSFGQKRYRQVRLKETPEKFFSEKLRCLPEPERKRLAREIMVKSRLLYRVANNFTNKLNNLQERISKTFFGKKFKGGSAKAKIETEQIINEHIAVADAIDSFIKDYGGYLNKFTPKIRGCKGSQNPVTHNIHAAWELINYCEDYINYLLKDIRLMEEKEKQ